MGERKPFATERLTFAALLIALQVVLGNLIQVPFIGKQFNFGFLPIAAAGALLGPVPAAVVGALGDFIGAHLFPQGAYFPGFTLTNALVGLIYALVLYRRKPSWLRAAGAALAGSVINLLLNSLWLSILYGSKTYWGWIVARAATYPAEAAAQAILIMLCLTGLGRLKLPGRMKWSDKEKL